jgi:hypothetical protein
MHLSTANSSFRTERLMIALGMIVRHELPGRSWRQSNDLNAFADENAAECVRVFRVPIENQIVLAA